MRYISHAQLAAARPASPLSAPSTPTSFLPSHSHSTPSLVHAPHPSSTPSPSTSASAALSTPPTTPSPPPSLALLTKPLHARARSPSPARLRDRLPPALHLTLRTDFSAPAPAPAVAAAKAREVGVGEKMHGQGRARLPRRRGARKFFVESEGEGEEAREHAVTVATEVPEAGMTKRDAPPTPGASCMQQIVPRLWVAFADGPLPLASTSSASTSTSAAHPRFTHIITITAPCVSASSSASPVAQVHEADDTAPRRLHLPLPHAPADAHTRTDAPFPSTAQLCAARDFLRAALLPTPPMPGHERDSSDVQVLVTAPGLHPAAALAVVVLHLASTSVLPSSLSSFAPASALPTCSVAPHAPFLEHEQEHPGEERVHAVLRCVDEDARVAGWWKGVLVAPRAVRRVAGVLA